MPSVSSVVQATTLHELFQASVAASPDALAITTDGVSLSYRALADRAASITARLAALGVGPDVIVGLLAGRSNELVAGVIGILGAGGAYLPLDASHPADRWTLVLEDAGVGIVVTTSQFAEGMRRSGMRVVLLDDDDDRPAVAVAPPTSRACAENLAYVIYTSGSTGRPKGVMVTHRNVVRLLRSTEGWFGFRGDDVWTLFHSIAFDFSVWEVWGALAYGGRLVVVPQAVTRDPRLFLQLLDREGVTVLNQTPSAFRALIEAEARSGDAGHLAALRWMIFGGEALPMHLLRPWYDRHPEGRPRLMNMYGITETTVHVTGRELSAADVDGPSVIGDPIPDLRIELLDDRLEAVEDGLPGEIVVSGAGVALGYLGLPDLTAERFVPDPSSPAARRYRSGDLGRRLPDGDLEYLGRIDQQVKIRGHRVEPGEVEAVAAAHPLVAAVAVVPYASADGTALAAFVVRTDRSDHPIEGLRAWLGDRLPAALVPSRIVSVPELPLTPNGKLDRDRLLELLPKAAGAGPPPRPGTETTLADAWHRVLGVAPGREDDFFEHGGNSLAAMRLAAEIERLFGVRLPVTVVFGSPRVRDLAAAVDAAVGSRRLPSPAHPAGDAVAVPATEGDMPALPSQRGMWLLDELLPDRAAYNQPFAFRPRGPIDWGVVRAGLARAMDAHPALRACLVGSDGGVVQRSPPPGTVALPWNEDPTVGPEAIAAVLAGRARVPFDLARAPLWRIDLFPAAAPHGVLLLVFHHAIIDDWSMRVLLDDVSATRAGGIVPMSHGSELDSPDVANRRVWWGERLQGAPAGVAWPGTAEVREPSGRGAIVSFDVPAEVVDRWRSIARSVRSTLFPALLGAFHLWLERVGGCDDTVVLTPVADRSAAEHQSSIGCRLDVVPSRMVRSAAGGVRTAANVAADVRASFIDSLAHLLPFDDIVAAVPGASGSRLQPLSNVMFVLVEQGALARTIAGVPVDEVDVHTGASRFDLTMTLSVEPGGGLRGRVEYSHDVLDRATVGGLVERFVALLQEVAEDPSRDVDALDLLSDDERARVGGQWDGAVVAPEPPMTVHGLLAEVAATRADAVAILEGGRRSSYRDLDRLACKVWRRLRDLGIGAGSRVGVTVPRSAEYVAVVLGVLRSGAAWVPIDVGAAASRAEFIAADAGLAAVVARGGVTVRIPDGVPVIDVASIPADTGVGASAGGGVWPEDPDALAYVMYTSGSTGKPKGVRISHRALVSFLRAMQRRHPLGVDDAFLFSTGTTFDISLYEIFGPLFAGARIVVSPPGHPDPGEIALLMGTEGVSVAQFVPAFLDVLVSDGGLRHASRLRRVFCGGEAMPAALPSRFRAVNGAELVNVYGPTEVTIWATSWSCDPGDGDVGIPIGRPLDNVRARILDAAGRLLPVGVQGELFLGGPQLAVGYHGRADLTAERFVADPWGGVGERLYRTGDLCRWREDGAIEYLGRLDDQVKIRGHRVELGEIEACLAEHPLVERAAACLNRGGDGEVEVVGFVIGDAAIGDGSAVVAHAAGRLPSVMVPARVVRVGEFPLNANGKLDRKALLESDPGPATRPSPGAAVSAGRCRLSGLEMTILAAWQRSFSRHDVGPDENFFDLGGNSLRAITLVADVSSALGRRVPVATVFRAPTVRGMAGLLGSNAWQPRFRSLVPLQPLGDAPPLLLCHGWGGGVSHYLPLARALGPEIPVYGILATGFDGSGPRQESMCAMIDTYVGEILRLGSSGPIHLGGFSAGGVYAYEVARELRRRGVGVGMLALIDSPAPAIVPRRADVARRVGRAVDGVLKIRRSSPGDVLKMLGRFLSRSLTAVPPASDPYVELASAHPSGNYHGQVISFESDDATSASRGAWRALVVGELRVHRCSTDHLGMLDDAHVGRIAGVMRDAMA